MLNDCGSTKNLVYYGGDYIGLQDEYGFLWWDVDIITINNEIIQYDDYTMNEDILDLFIKE